LAPSRCLSPVSAYFSSNFPQLSWVLMSPPRRVVSRFFILFISLCFDTLSSHQNIVLSELSLLISSFHILDTAFGGLINLCLHLVMPRRSLKIHSSSYDCCQASRTFSFSFFGAWFTRAFSWKNDCCFDCRRVFSPAYEFYTSSFSHARLNMCCSVLMVAV